MSAVTRGERKVLAVSNLIRKHEMSEWPTAFHEPTAVKAARFVAYHKDRRLAHLGRRSKSPYGDELPMGSRTTVQAENVGGLNFRDRNGIGCIPAALTVVPLLGNIKR